MLTRWRLPPESVPTSSSARPARRVWASMRWTASSTSGTFSSRANRRRFSATDSLRYTAACWGTQPTCSRSSEIRPELGRWMPARIDSSVVLPAPLGPMTATRSPGLAVNETSRRATRSP